MESTIKDIFLSVIDFIDTKLQTKTGRIALLIASCIIFGVSVTYAYTINNKYDEKVKELVEVKIDLKVVTKEKDQRQEELRTVIKNADADCNEQIRQGAILQRQLQEIYAGKTEENKNFVKQQELIIKEKEKLTKIQDNNVSNLKSLNIK